MGIQYAVVSALALGAGIGSEAFVVSKGGRTEFGQAAPGLSQSDKGFCSLASVSSSSRLSKVQPKMSALVTGGSGGIGGEIAKELARRGENVIVHYSGSKGKADAVVSEIKEEGGNAIALKADVTKRVEVEDLFKAAEEAFSEPVEILVNNAGITRDGFFVRMSEADWNAVINTNLSGVFHCSQVAAKKMMKARNGRIINIASVVGQMGNPGQANYAAAKGGVIALTKALAKELARRNVLLFAVCPGYIDTPMTEGLDEEKVTSMIPAGRKGKPEEIARVVAFYAFDPAASYMSGNIESINGGML